MTAAHVMSRHAALALLVAAGCWIATAAPAAACVGDCNGDGRVVVNELVTGVNIALSKQPASTCPAFDSNVDGEVRINELLAGVANGTGGCRDATATPTVTPLPNGGTETRCAVPPGDGVNFDPEQPFCELLSSYRFFRDGAAQAPNDGVLPYDLNTPLFSDYATKHRFVWMPPGSSAAYSEHDSFAFPVGTVIIKTFSYLADLRDRSSNERLIETRLLVRRDDGWDAVTYLWNAAETEATRRIIGARVPVSWIQADGSERSITYRVPNTNQCKECHDEHNGELGPLGPKARNLNREHVYGDGTANQLERWVEVGYLTGAPSPDEAPRSAVFDDPTTGSLDERARAYLDVNCGHCHNPTGLARTSGLYLDIDEMTPLRYGVCKGPVAAGQGSGGRKVDIFPGEPDQSILTFRMESTMAGIAMPELGRQTNHEEALAVIRAWIEALPGTCE